MNGMALCPIIVPDRSIRMGMGKNRPLPLTVLKTTAILTAGDCCRQLCIWAGIGEKYNRGVRDYQERNAHRWFPCNVRQQ
jgi:hypothetical protein